MKVFLKSMFTDREWDGDIVKVVGFVLVVLGMVGWFAGRDPVVPMGLGSTLLATGKFSKEG